MVTDKERLATLEEKVGILEDDHKKWREVICGALKRVIYGAMGLVGVGIASGWHMPETLRKIFAEWIGK